MIGQLLVHQEGLGQQAEAKPKVTVQAQWDEVVETVEDPEVADATPSKKEEKSGLQLG